MGDRPSTTSLPLLRKLSAPAWAMIGLILLGVVTIGTTVWDYGISWDEGVQSRYGELVLEYFQTAGRVNECNSYRNLSYYGPLFETVAAVLYQWTPPLKYDIRHALTALSALATLPALYLIGRRLGSAWIGVLAGLALLLMPRFYGHSFINSKDIPFACAFSWTMVALLNVFSPGELRARHALSLGVAAGITLAVRPAGFALILVMGAASFAWMAIYPTDPQATVWRPKFLVGLLVALLIAWVIMVVPWPYAHKSPVLGPIRAMREAMDFGFAYPVLFEGSQVMSDQLPFYYLPKYVFITAPVAVLLFAGLGIANALARLWRERRAPASATYLLLGAWLFLPLILYVIRRPNVYDGMRHFLFVLPALAMWYAIGVASLITRLSPGPKRLVAGMAAGVITLCPIVSIATLHPYETTYFNGLVGGLKGAAGNYETDYWITSYREAIEWVNEQAKSQPGGTVNVLVAAPGNAKDTVKWFNDDNVNVQMIFGPQAAERIPAGFDYYIGSSRYGQNKHFPQSPIVHVVGREGATFCVIRGR